MNMVYFNINNTNYETYILSKFSLNKSKFI